ncbi:MAG: hypothetical protein AAF355_03760 [Myxococcota bacterium]
MAHLTTAGVDVREHQILGTRSFEAVIGESVPDAVLPLVVQIHGRGGQAMTPKGDFLSVQYPYRLLIPQALTPHAHGWTWLPHSVTSGRYRELAHALAQESERLARVIEAFLAMRPTLGRPIVTGFSQGAMLTLSLALNHARLVHTALPIASWLPLSMVPLEFRESAYRPQIRAMHGTHDRITRVGAMIVLVERLRELGIEVDLRLFEGVGHEMTKELWVAHNRDIEEALRSVRKATLSL